MQNNPFTKVFELPAFANFEQYGLPILVGLSRTEESPKTINPSASSSNPLKERKDASNDKVGSIFLKLNSNLHTPDM